MRKTDQDTSRNTCDCLVHLQGFYILINIDIINKNILYSLKLNSVSISSVTLILYVQHIKQGLPSSHVNIRLE